MTPAQGLAPLAALIAIFVHCAPAQAACDPSAGLTFVCGLSNAGDLVSVPGTPWIIAGGLAGGKEPQGHIYLLNARERYATTLLPGHITYALDRKTFADCPGQPDESKFSAHGLDLPR
jgi:hypothetical protein